MKKPDNFIQCPTEYMIEQNMYDLDSNSCFHESFMKLDAMFSSLLYRYDRGQIKLHELIALATHRIIKTHPFINGNKRAALYFFHYMIYTNYDKPDEIISDTDLYGILVSIADNTTNETTFIEWLGDKTKRTKRKLNKLERDEHNEIYMDQCGHIVEILKGE